MSVSNDKFATHMGFSREVMSRLLKEFERKGLIRLSRGQIDRLF